MNFFSPKYSSASILTIYLPIYLFAKIKKKIKSEVYLSAYTSHITIHIGIECKNEYSGISTQKNFINHNRGN